jgi:hypothetical protein
MLEIVIKHCPMVLLQFEKTIDLCENEGNANIANNFDYEHIAPNNYNIFIDINVKMYPIAIRTRTSFSIESDDVSWDTLFVLKYITPMVDHALTNAYNSFVEHFNNNCDDTINEIPVIESVTQMFSQGIISQYQTLRKNDDIKNAYLIKNTGLEIITGTSTILTIHPTFVILDEIVYNNPQFNRKQNRKTLFDVIPEPQYTTIKLHCLQILEKDVVLNYYDTIMFFQCLDCALQVLMGDKADKLQAVMHSNGFDSDAQAIFIKQGTTMFKQLRNTLKDSNARILNLETNYDWIHKMS